MPFFSGVPPVGSTAPKSGPIDWDDIPQFMEQCLTDGWRRLAITESRILASFNEHGKWMHPELSAHE